jgi:hypothetical protein
MNVSQIVLVFAVGAIIAYLTWQACGSGEISLRFGRLRRAESPSTFQIVLVLRALLGVLCVAAGVWGIFGAAPHG